MRHHLVRAAVLAAAYGACAVDAKAAILVQNGGFELNATGGSTVVGQVNVYTTLQNWTVSAPQNSGQAHAFAFVVNANADSSGFPSENTPGAGRNIFVWGPNTPALVGGPSPNGFTGSPDGGNFLGIDGDYARGSISQTINGLTPGQQYALSFHWAGSEFTDAAGTTAQWWTASLGSGASQDTAHLTVAPKGFTGWQSATLNFTADATSDLLTFLPGASPFTNGAPAGLPPFLLLDGVTLNPASVPEPSSLALISIAAGLCLVGGVKTRLRRAKLARA